MTRPRGVSVPKDLKQVYILCVLADNYPALSFQAQQFLKFQTAEGVPPPFVMDVFTLDAMTEMLESPLRLLSYVDRRTEYYSRLIGSHELTCLAYHLKKNRWLSDELDVLMLHDDISADLEVAMAVRRDSMPGARTPDGILTRVPGTALGRIIREIEAKPDAATIELGLMLLTLSGDTVVTVSKKIVSFREACVTAANQPC